MYRLIFENSVGEKTAIRDFDTYKNAIQGMMTWLKGHAYEPPYIRTTANDKDYEVWLDVGSHTEFFYIQAETEEEFKKIFVED